ncbi:UNVERIFIED_CONTAM: hypothetical protein Sangu_2664400 [Sesamum angustifolium]|uniref:Uncharacterized protein n=1 Tax=Sesamum angustifolium TaxID=2727405 RepID=A0AAW2J1N8_9LAMI
MDICMRDILVNGGEPFNFLPCSITTCGYIVLQFLKLSPQESQQDPIYFVLLRNRKKDGTESKRFLSIVSARILFTALGCLMLGTLIYTIATDGSPFRRDVLTPCKTPVERHLAHRRKPVLGARHQQKGTQHHQVELYRGSIDHHAIKTPGEEGVAVAAAAIFIKQGRISHLGYGRRSTAVRPAEEKRRRGASDGVNSDRNSALTAREQRRRAVRGAAPQRREEQRPSGGARWMSATLIDFYVNVFALSVWVAYKESNWKTAALWIILLICFGRRLQQISFDLIGTISLHVPRLFLITAFLVFLTVQMSSLSITDLLSVRALILFCNFSISRLEMPSSLFFSAATAGKSVTMMATV